MDGMGMHVRFNFDLPSACGEIFIPQNAQDSLMQSYREKFEYFDADNSGEIECDEFF